MTDTIQHFFDAWGDTDAGQRQDRIAAAMADIFTHADPRSEAGRVAQPVGFTGAGGLPA